MLRQNILAVCPPSSSYRHTNPLLFQPWNGTFWKMAVHLPQSRSRYTAIRAAWHCDLQSAGFQLPKRPETRWRGWITPLASGRRAHCAKAAVAQSRLIWLWARSRAWREGDFPSLDAAEAFLTFQVLKNFSRQSSKISSLPSKKLTPAGQSRNLRRVRGGNHLCAITHSLKACVMTPHLGLHDVWLRDDLNRKPH